jgi:hypothetical protein
MKGRFQHALRLAEGLPWVKDDKGKWSVEIQADIQAHEPEPSDGVPSLLPSSLSVTTGDSGSRKGQIISLLGISDSLTVRSKSIDLCLAYAKYQGVLHAQAEMQRMIADGTWTLGKVSGDTLIEVFVSKSVWHGYYTKLFPRAKRYPTLLKWLENGEGAPVSVDVFGVVKQGYNFSDLKLLLEQLDARASKKEKKRKSREGEESSVSPSKKQRQTPM